MRLLDTLEDLISNHEFYVYVLCSLLYRRVLGTGTETATEAETQTETETERQTHAYIQSYMHTEDYHFLLLSTLVDRASEHLAKAAFIEQILGDDGRGRPGRIIGPGL